MPVTRLQQEVSAVLESAGLPLALNYLTDDGLFSISLALEVNGRPVALEIADQHQFSSNAPLYPLSDMPMRRQLLQERGWEVVNVSYHEWAAMGSSVEERSAALLLRIADELGTVEWRSLGLPSQKGPSLLCQEGVGGMLKPACWGAAAGGGREGLRTSGRAAAELGALQAERAAWPAAPSVYTPAAASGGPPPDALSRRPDRDGSEQLGGADVQMAQHICSMLGLEEGAVQQQQQRAYA